MLEFSIVLQSNFGAPLLQARVVLQFAVGTDRFSVELD